MLLRPAVGPASVAAADVLHVTVTCVVARQPTVTSRRRVDDGDDDAELVCRVDNQLAAGRDEVSRRDALRNTPPTYDGDLALPLVTVARGDENER